MNFCFVETQTASPQLNSPAEIVKNLPKVWKVLIELLNQQNPPENVLIEPDEDNPCYKLVETPKGPKLVLSVSQTFIRLKVMEFVLVVKIFIYDHFFCRI